MNPVYTSVKPTKSGRGSSAGENTTLAHGTRRCRTVASSPSTTSTDVTERHRSPHRHPGARTPRGRPTARRSAPRPQHGNVHQRLPGLAVGDARHHPGTQCCRCSSEHDIVWSSGHQRRARGDGDLGQPAARLGPLDRHDGIVGMWYGKGPGVDRCGDVFKHANFMGVGENGGVLALGGDDPVSKSSTLPTDVRADLLRLRLPDPVPRHDPRGRSTSASTDSRCRRY